MRVKNDFIIWHTSAWKSCLNDHSPSVWTHCNPLYIWSVSPLWYGQFSTVLITTPICGQWKWSVYVYTSRENLTLLPPNSKGAGQNTHLRSLIIAFISRYLLTCETARPKSAALSVFTVRAHYWINLISRAMIRLQKLCRLIYASACKKAIFLRRVFCRVWSGSILFGENWYSGFGYASMGIYQGQLCMCDKFQHGRLSGAFAHVKIRIKILSGLI